MITILTEPSTRWTYKVYRTIRLLVKKHILKRSTSPYSGHYAVVRSLIEGYNRIGEPFIYNPKQKSKITDHVHVIAGAHVLQYAIKLKKQGRIKRLTAGPNIVVSASDKNGLIASQEIDFCITPSEWVKTLYVMERPSLKERIGCCPSGVDADCWKIEKSNSNSLRLAFYKKSPDPILYQECLQIAKANQAHVTEIHYGSYSLDELKSALSEVDFVIFFSKSESQGIALAEIWASDTPTIVWNLGHWQYEGKIYTASSAPYLTKDTGLFFKTRDDFKMLFEQHQLVKEKFKPREWVLNNMTDEICTRNFLKTVAPIK